MALGATVYNFKIELADSDRGVYDHWICAWRGIRRRRKNTC